VKKNLYDVDHALLLTNQGHDTLTNLGYLFESQLKQDVKKVDACGGAPVNAYNGDDSEYYGGDHIGGDYYGDENYGGYRRRRLLAEAEATSKAVVDRFIVEKANMLWSTGSTMLIHFHSSYSTSTTGFSMTYSYEKAATLVSAPLTGDLGALVGVPVDFVLKPRKFTSTTVDQTLNYSITLADGQNLTIFDASLATITFANLTIRVIANQTFTL
jgi:hypothetical protein